MSAMNDENGDRAPDDGGPSNEAENNNDISSGSRDQVCDFGSVVNFHFTGIFWFPVLLSSSRFCCDLVPTSYTNECTSSVTVV